MRSRKHKKKSAYRRGEKTVRFFRKGIMVFSVFIVLALVVLSAKLLARTFPVKNILVSGNYHLGEDDVKEILNIREDENFFRLSFHELETRLKRMPWIKKVALRKQFPYTLMIKIDEAVPKALLRLNSRMFLIDTDGYVLEEIGDKSTPFLPVIMGIDPKKDRGGILEALKLINALDAEDVLSEKETIKIMLRPYGLAMNLDGELVKVGFGKYADKLGRWKKLEAKIRNENIPVDYVDLRFKNSVIVKPLKSGKTKFASGAK